MEYETLAEYHNIARKAISKFASKMYPSMLKKMLDDDEFVGEVAQSIMAADWKWDPSRSGKTTGLKKTLYSYRNQCALWTIQTFVTQQYKYNKKRHKLKKYAAHASQTSDSFLASHETPYQILEDKELLNNTKSTAEFMLANSGLTDKSKNIIDLYYYKNKTLAEIGEIYGVSREAIRQNLKKELQEIKTCYAK